MDDFDYKDGQLHAEDVPLARIAEEVGTPAYVYSRRTIERHFERIVEAFAGVETLVCYSTKANGNLAVLRLLAGLGSGFDVVSVGELERILRIDGDPKKIVFAGVGKTEAELRRALETGILMFNVESEQEVEVIDAVGASIGKRAPLSIRVNPDVDPRTHKYISTGKEENKFGIDLDRARDLVARLGSFEHVELAGIHMHIGSQITDVEPYARAVDKVVGFASECREAGHAIEWVNTGGGFGIFYRGGEALPASAFAEAIVPPIVRAGFRLILEPGRFIVGNAGVLLTRVQYVKRGGRKTFVICDAGMNDLIRPSLYSAYHRVWPVATDLVEPTGDPGPTEGLVLTDVVGPICESGDFFALDRLLPELARGDLLSVFSAGAYAAVMSSNYNTRPRAPEVLVEGDAFRVVRRRETVDDLLALEMP